MTSINNPAKKTLRIAVEGCCHGELNKIYSQLTQPIDLLIICGDFQAIRNARDLDTINVPPKFRRIGDFQEYYKGKRTAPVLTIFIGGNHEASSYMKELKYGGWVAPNIYYLGEFGSIWFKGLQIGGISGIFNRWTFEKNSLEDEILPYDDKSIRSIYHTTLKNFLKFYLMNHSLDIGLSHDWPAEIERKGDVKYLLKVKPFFKNDINNGALGSPLNKFLLSYLRPRYWFSSHLHVRFTASVRYDHEKIQENNYKNDDEIDLDMDDEDEVEEEQDDSKPFDFENQLNFDKSSNEKSMAHKRLRFAQDPISTEFLALDKCLPKRKCIEVLDIDVTPDHLNHPSVNYDGFVHSKRAIAINKVVETYLQDEENVKHFKRLNSESIRHNPRRFTLVNELNELVEVELNKLNQLSNDEFKVDSNDFKIIAPVYQSHERIDDIPLKYWENTKSLIIVRNLIYHISH
ncbi:hypothetical protein DFJ63DRAFT_242076 [Scheffersomyces coipomensis]|uniref:uncharacterized protein n=1 Tax=Scheffersomyces coipomensis TaxID=1788519 RepID=UPI00315C6ECF